MLKDFFVYLSPSVVTGALGLFVMVPITTYYLDPKDFGIYSIIQAISSPINPLSSMGFTWVLAANYFKLDGVARKELVFNVVIVEFLMRILAVAIFWVFSDFIVKFLIPEYHESYRVFIRVMLATFVLSGAWPVVSYLITLEQKPKLHAAIDISQWLFGAITTIVCLVVLELKTLTLFLAPLASSLLCLVAGVFYLRTRVTPRIKMSCVREIVRVGAPSLPANIADVLKNIVDRYCIQRFFSLHQLGIYSHSLSYRNVFGMASKAFSRAFYPDVLKLYTSGGDPAHLNSTLKKWLWLSVAVWIPVSLFAREFISVLTHGKFNAAAPLVPVWFLLVFSSIYGSPYLNFLMARKHSVLTMKITLTINLLSLPVTAMAVKFFGISGAAFSLVGTTFATQLLCRHYALRHGAHNWGGAYKTISGLLVATVILIALNDLTVQYKVFVALFMICAVIALKRKDALIPGDEVV